MQIYKGCYYPPNVTERLGSVLLSPARCIVKSASESLALPLLAGSGLALLLALPPFDRLARSVSLITTHHRQRLTRLGYGLIASQVLGYGLEHLGAYPTKKGIDALVTLNQTLDSIVGGEKASKIRNKPSVLLLQEMSAQQLLLLALSDDPEITNLFRNAKEVKFLNLLPSEQSVPALLSVLARAPHVTTITIRDVLCPPSQRRALLSSLRSYPELRDLSLFNTGLSADTIAQYFPHHSGLQSLNMTLSNEREAARLATVLRTARPKPGPSKPMNIRLSVDNELIVKEFCITYFGVDIEKIGCKADQSVVSRRKGVSAWLTHPSRDWLNAPSYRFHIWGPALQLPKLQYLVEGACNNADPNHRFLFYTPVPVKS